MSDLSLKRKQVGLCPHCGAKLSVRLPLALIISNWMFTLSILGIIIFSIFFLKEPSWLL